MSFDVLIRNGLLADGTGVVLHPADVGITSDRITAIGDLANASAGTELEASGQVIAPGFIDVHAHADAALLNDGIHSCGILQGVTTEIITPDGIGFAPLSPTNFALHAQYLSGILGPPPDGVNTSNIASFRQHYHHHTTCNVAMFAGHGPIRIEAAGFEDVPLVGERLATAIRVLEESLEQGACGFATGLSYYPQSYSNSEELIELCKVARKYDAPLSIHLRNHNTARALKGGGVLEAIEVAKVSGVKLHLEHYRTQPPTAGRVEELLAPVEDAIRNGVDITLETYGYPVGSSHPPQFLPGWVHEGGAHAMLARLKDRKLRGTLIEAMKTQMPGGIMANAWTFIGSERNSHLQGRSFQDAAELRGQTVEEMVIDVLAEEEMSAGFRGVPPESITVWRQVEADIMLLMQRKDYMIGSDSIPVGPLPHPRAWGCFARMLGRLRRRHGIPLETMIQRTTQLPAERFGLRDRGVLKQGAFADIVVFDASKLNDRATFEDPQQPAEGVRDVVVNGNFVVKNEKVTGVLAGRAIP